MHGRSTRCQQSWKQVQKSTHRIEQKYNASSNPNSSHPSYTRSQPPPHHPVPSTDMPLPTIPSDPLARYTPTQEFLQGMMESFKTGGKIPKRVAKNISSSSHVASPCTHPLLLCSRRLLDNQSTHAHLYWLNGYVEHVDHYARHGNSEQSQV